MAYISLEHMHNSDSSNRELKGRLLSIGETHPSQNFECSLNPKPGEFLFPTFVDIYWITER